MVRALRTGIMLLTLLLVVVGFLLLFAAFLAEALPALWPGTSANTGSWRLMI